MKKKYSYALILFRKKCLFDLFMFSCSVAFDMGV